MAVSGSRLAVLVAALATSVAAPVPADTSVGHELGRDVLVVSNAGQAEHPRRFPDLRQIVETPLAHLGMRAIHHDWRGEGEPPAVGDGVRGALVWFEGSSLREPERFLRWAVELMDAGRYLVLAGDLAFLHRVRHGATDPVALARFFDALGVELHEDELDDFEPLRVRISDRRVVGRERAIERDLPRPPSLSVGPHPEAHVYLSVEDSAGTRSDVVARTSGGAIIAPGYGYSWYTGIDRGYWASDPIEVFREGFRLSGVPIPDITTLAGRRLYFSTVHGRGWNATSAVADGAGVRRPAAAVLLEETIRPYPDLPVTVGPLGADLDPRFLGSRASVEIARELFRLPQVESAVHTYSEPLDWRYYAPRDYSAEHERALYGRVARPTSRVDALVARLGRWLGPAPTHGASYVDARRARPRTHYTGDFDLEREIDGMFERLAALAPEGKPPRLMLWSGHGAEPFHAALARVHALGLANLGGGSTRFDPAFASLSYVSPPSRRVGDRLQVHAAMSGAMHYLEHWPALYFDFADLLHTIERTGAPVRLRPIQLHYPVLSAERRSTLDAVKRVLEDVRGRRVVPITAARYARIVEGADAVRFVRTERGWRILERGALETIRFDGVPLPTIDYRASPGALGHVDFQGSRYVALDPALETIELVIRTDRAAPRRVTLLESRWPVRDVAFEAESVSFRWQGYGAGTATWRFPHVCGGHFSVRHDDGRLEEATVLSDARGTVSVSALDPPVNGADAVLTCAAANR